MTSGGHQRSKLPVNAGWNRLNPHITIIIKIMTLNGGDNENDRFCLKWPIVITKMTDYLGQNDRCWSKMTDSYEPKWPIFLNKMTDYQGQNDRF